MPSFKVSEQRTMGNHDKWILSLDNSKKFTIILHYDGRILVYAHDIVDQSRDIILMAGEDINKCLLTEKFVYDLTGMNIPLVDRLNSFQLEKEKKYSLLSKDNYNGRQSKGMLYYEISGTNLVLVIGTGTFQTMKYTTIVTDSKPSIDVVRGWDEVKAFIKTLTGEDIDSIHAKFINSFRD
jgi:hypothetical protein